MKLSLLDTKLAFLINTGRPLYCRSVSKRLGGRWWTESGGPKAAGRAWTGSWVGTHDAGTGRVLVWQGV